MIRRLHTRFGADLIIGVAQGVLRFCDWENSRHLERHLRQICILADGCGDEDVAEAAARQLEEYFRGERRDFNLTLTPCCGTAFQQRVWTLLTDIPRGTTVTYGQLAAGLGMTRRGVRAVAAAVGANPLSVIVPCHRVIGADGSLTGYAGGVDVKCRLLTLEGIALLPARD